MLREIILLYDEITDYNASKLLLRCGNYLLAVDSENIGWTLPGGKRDENEKNPFLTLERELKEEIPWCLEKLWSFRRLSLYDHENYKTVVFECQTKDMGIGLPSSEIKEVSWMTEDDFWLLSKYWRKFFGNKGVIKWT